VTGEPAERARFYLESSAWDLEVALGSFYESDALDVDDLEAARPEAAPEPPAPRPAAAEEESGGGSGSGGAASRPAPAGNINTFASRFGKSTRENDEDDSDSEEEGQAFYAGGSTTSGQQILGPTRKKEGSDFVKQMFKKARENGAEAVDPNTLAGHAHGGASGSRAFSGAGFKLGSTGR
jgi:UBX domain-containing protein 1